MMKKKTSDTETTALSDAREALAAIETRIESAAEQLANARTAAANAEDRLVAATTRLTDADAAYRRAPSDPAWADVEAARSAKARAEVDLSVVRPLAEPFASARAEAERERRTALEVLRLAELDALEAHDEALRTVRGALVLTNPKHWPLMLCVQGHAAPNGIEHRVDTWIGVDAQTETALRFDLSPDNTASAEALNEDMLRKAKHWAESEGMHVRIEHGHRAFAAGGMGTFKGGRQAAESAKAKVIHDAKRKAAEVRQRLAEKHGETRRSLAEQDRARKMYGAPIEKLRAIEKAYEQDLTDIANGAA